MSDYKSYRAASRDDWGTKGNISLGEVNTGALLRIADATELMAKNHNDLIRECDDLKASREYWKSDSKRLERQITALKGVITRQRKQIQALKATK